MNDTKTSPTLNWKFSEFPKVLELIQLLSKSAALLGTFAVSKR